MKGIFQSNLSLTLMVLFVTTNIPCIFANNTISYVNLSTIMRNYLKSIFYTARIIIGSICPFLILLIVIERILKTRSYSEDKIYLKAKPVCDAMCISAIIGIIYSFIIPPIIVNFCPSYSSILLFQIPLGISITCAAGGIRGMMLPSNWIPESP